MENRDMKLFVVLCKMQQNKLKWFLNIWLKKYYSEIIDEDGFLYAKGTDKILLTAHMDTVHKVQCSKIDCQIAKGGKRFLSSEVGIGGDDRCGIYMIIKIIETTKLRPSILFCEDEEIGCVGSRKFCKTEYIKDLYNMLFLIELDRANANDLVFYRDTNYDFHKFCENVTGYKWAYGTRSDISNLSPACGVSSVNISCGYYNQHKVTEYVVWEEMQNSISATIKLIVEGIAKNVMYKYKAYQTNTGYYSRYDDDYDDYYYGGYSNYYGYGYRKTQNSDSDEDYTIYEFSTSTHNYYGVGRNAREALGDVMMVHKTLSYSQILTWKIVNKKEMIK